MKATSSFVKQQDKDPDAINWYDILLTAVGWPQFVCLYLNKQTEKQTIFFSTSVKATSSFVKQQDKDLDAINWYDILLTVGWPQ